MLYPTHKANGKLLLTSEYFVLDGANAIALPTKFGQTLFVTLSKKAGFFIHWIGLDSSGNSWIELFFDTKLLPSQMNDMGQRLSDVLKVCIDLNPDKLQLEKSYVFTTEIDFDRSWGLGTSSTLISLLADFFNINPYLLLEKTFGGSGYDIACARAEGPLLYNNKNAFNPEVKPISFHKSFSESIYFAYLGNKQNSRDGIQHYKSRSFDKIAVIEKLEEINQRILKSEQLSDFELALEEHEQIISENLNIPRLSDTLFIDYWGSVKSLGAWGGDFILLTNTKSSEELESYLDSKDIQVVFPFADIIL